VVDITELIDQAITTDDAEPVVRALLDAGPQALTQVMTTVNAESNTFLPALYEVIRRSTYPEAVPILISNASSSSAAAVRSIFLALGASSDSLASAFILERLTDSKELVTTRAAAAEALYGSDIPNAVETLHTVLEEQRADPSDEEWMPLLVVNVATALATMNDHSGARALYRLLRSEHDSGRAMAVRAFRVVLDDNTFIRLTDMADDPSAEVRRAVVDPIFLLGAPASAKLLLRLAAKDDDYEVRYNSMIRFGDIMGLALSGPDDLSFAQEKWQELNEDLMSDVCYRFGDPITLDNLLEEFSEEEQLRASVAEELRLTTGINVPSIYVAEGIVAAQEAVSGIPFTTGRVHKWGYPQPMPLISLPSKP
jgi:HEAT repeat protein